MRLTSILNHCQLTAKFEKPLHLSGYLLSIHPCFRLIMTFVYYACSNLQIVFSSKFSHLITNLNT